MVGVSLRICESVILGFVNSGFVDFGFGGSGVKGWG